jgi:hypothetical protein
MIILPSINFQIFQLVHRLDSHKKDTKIKIRVFKPFLNLRNHEIQHKYRKPQFLEHQLFNCLIIMKLISKLKFLQKGIPYYQILVPCSA